MKRRQFVRKAAIGAVGATGVLAVACDDEPTQAGAPSVQTQHRVRWQLASSFPRSLDTIYGATFFALSPGHDVAQQLADDLGADSLDIAEIMMDLEDAFGIKLEDDQAEGPKTVGDIISYIEGKVAEKNG